MTRYGIHSPHVGTPSPFRSNKERRSYILNIRCSESTANEFRKRFYLFKAQGIVKNMDDFLKLILKSIPEKIEFR
jgi:hypothetical protein